MGCLAVWVCRVLLKVIWKAPPHGKTPNKVACAPHLLYGKPMERLVHEGGVVKLRYLSWSDGVSCKTSSHMCESWYFPKFLLREGSSTWIYMASFMFLVTTLWFPVNYGEALGAYWVSCTLAMVVFRGWGPQVFLESVPKGSAWFPYVFLRTVDVWAFKFIYNPTFLSLLSLSLGPWEGFWWC